MTTVANPTEEQIVIDWQPTGEDGKAIGKPTRIVAKDYPEAIEKMKEITQAAQREMFRIRSMKPEPRVAAPTAHQLSPEEAKASVDAIFSQNPDEARVALRRIVESEFGMTPDDVKGLKQERQRLTRQGETFRFLSSHLYDYNNNDANAGMLREYLERNNLAWTANNLEIAFLAVKDELIPVVTAAVNEPTAEPANPAPQRRAPSGMEPGSNGGRRPTTGFTRDDAIKMAKEMSTEDLRKWLNKPGNREKFERAINGR